MKNWQYFDPTFEYEQMFPDLDWPWAGHKYFVYDLIRSLKPKKIVELGTHKGTSLFSMAQAIKDGGLETELHAVDTWEGDAHAGFYSKKVFSEVRKIQKKYYSKQNITLHRSTFDESRDSFPNGSIDLLHIDGLHTYEAVKHDFDSWISKVNKYGIVILHDVFEKKDDFKVYKLWNELKRSYSTIEFTHSHGLGVLFKNAKDNLYSNYETVWQRYYQTQASYWLAKFSLVEKDNQILRINQQLSDLTRMLNSSTHDLDLITSSKFFKLWRRYNLTKESLLPNL